ncbi:MAG TPA: hemolysin III family protein, partial [Acidimicrobiales bacterium]
MLPTARPTLRGRLHQVAFFVSIPAGIALVVGARATAARVAAVIFAATLTGLYGVSAAYHRGQWSAGAHRLMKHLDHSMIFVFIAGTYTPFCVLLLPRRTAAALLTIGPAPGRNAASETSTSPHAMATKKAYACSQPRRRGLPRSTGRGRR